MGMAVDDTIEDPDLPYFVEHIQTPMARHEGDELPVSALLGWKTGLFQWERLHMKSAELHL